MSRNIKFGFAKKQMPSKCPDCGMKMSELKYDNKPWSHLSGSSSSVRYYRSCECGALLVWGYSDKREPAFIREHILPLFDFDETIMVVDKR